MYYIPRAEAHREEFFAALRAVPMPPEVVSVTPTLGEDWSGDPAVFVEVLVHDHVSRERLLPLHMEVSTAIISHVRPAQDWGVIPYFDFRSERLPLKQPA